MTSRSIVRLVLLAVAVATLSAPGVAQETGCWVQGDRADLELRASPFDSTFVALPLGKVQVCYSQPRRLGRPIFGRLIPYGQAWRLGADEATSIYLPVQGTIAGVTVGAGWYSLYAVPGERDWRIVVNGTARRWGTPIDSTVRAKDIGTGTVRAELVAKPEELLRIRIDRVTPERIELVMHWDHTLVRIPVTLLGTRPRGEY